MKCSSACLKSTTRSCAIYLIQNVVSISFHSSQKRTVSNTDKKKGLRVREHPKKGFWAENLTVVTVDSYDDISQRMEEGLFSLAQYIHCGN